MDEKLDTTDLRIIDLLQHDARMTNSDIAGKIGLTPSATLERIRKLRDNGIITGYEARINPEAVGLGVAAFVFVRTESDGSPKVAHAICKMPEVMELHMVAGEDCYLAKVRARDTQSLGKLIHERISKLPSVISTRTTIAMETFKESCALPIAIPARKKRKKK